MSSYDYLNGNQINLFKNPILVFPQKELCLDTCIYWSFGSFINYKKKEAVPFQSFYYNYKKDFNIIDILPNDNLDKISIHRIRDGKYISSTKNFKKEDFTYSFFNIYGEKLNIYCRTDIKSYKNINIFIKDISFNSSKINSKNYMNFLKDNVNYYSVESEKKKKDLEFLYFEELKENKEKIAPYKALKQSFLKQSEIKDEYIYYGGLIKALLLKKIDIFLDNNYQFFMQDERLLFIHGYNVFKNVQKNINESDYFNNLDFTKDMKNEYQENLIEIEKLYEKILNLKFKKEKFNIHFALPKIETYKEYYLKYNIIPYENFDMWN